MIEIRKYMSKCKFLEDLSCFLLWQGIGGYIYIYFHLTSDMFGHKKDLIGYLLWLF
jgi:hypothetical protein